MEAVVHVATLDQMNPDDSLVFSGYYTEISTDITWDENAATEHVLFDDRNATVISTTVAPEDNVNMTRVLLASVALLIINLAVILGNILILLAVYCERALRTVTNYFIVNLAIADLLLGTLVLPFSSAFEVIHYWPFGGAFCDIWAAVDVLCCTASINSLCCISVDRYIGVTRPLKHRLIMTPRRALTINIFVWIISFGIAVGPLFGWRPVKTSNMECPLSDSIGYVFFSVAGSFYIPSTIILILYFRIYRAVSRETKKIQARSQRRYGETGNGHAGHVILRIHVGSKRQTGENCSRRSDALSSGSSRSRNLSQRTATFNREKKVAKTLGIVVGVFIICWLPFFFLLPLTSVCPSCKIPQIVFTFFFWLGYCNSCVNPVIYAMSNLTFRKAFRKIITCWYCKDRQVLRRTLGSRRSSNVSRLTSSTPMLSPMVMSRVKRLTSNTTSNRFVFRRKSTSTSTSQPTNSKQHPVPDYLTCQADVNESNSNKVFCDKLPNERCGMSTVESTTVGKKSFREDEQSKPEDANQTTNSDDYGQFQLNRNNSMTLSDDSNNISNGFLEPLANSCSRDNESQCSNTDPSTAVSFKHLTNTHLSNGIYESKETPV